MTYLHHLCDPLVWAVLAGGFAVWRLRRRCPEARRTYRALVAAWCGLFLISLPITAHLLHRLLEGQHPPVAGRPEGIDCIIVLGGGVFPDVAGSPSSRLTEATTRRTLRGAELYREGPPCPVIVCGGIVRPDESDRSEASVMRDLLILVGVAAEDVVMDEESRNTWENSQRARRLLEDRSLKRPALVTDACHLPRAVACFRAQGFEPAPVGSGYRAWSETIDFLSFVPHSTAPLKSYYALHEMIGFASYRIRGRI